MVQKLWQENKGKLPTSLLNLTSVRKAVIGVVILILAVFAFVLFNNRTSNPSDNFPNVKINKSYEIIARRKDRVRTTGRFTLTVTDVTYADTILVQGKTARPVKGKLFLVLNMEIESTYQVSLYAFPVDLFRFVREDGKKFAPSTHQGTVQIRPESTKKSNVAFVVEPDEKNFKIEVGDVNEPKETLEINF